jgi:hypothetical protein
MLTKREHGTPATAQTPVEEILCDFAAARDP